MKLSTKGRYGLRAMIDLAIHYSQGQVTLSSIAQRQEISESYLEQLLNALKKAGLVNSSRGHQGGYILSKKPEEITVSMIMDVLEGTLAPVHCVDECPPSTCKRFNVCATKNVWKKVKDNIYDVISSISLQQLAEDQIALDKLGSDKIGTESAVKKESNVIVIKNPKKEVNNIAFYGSWLIEKEKAIPENGTQELQYSIALTEKGKLFALFEDIENLENNGYSIFSSLEELETSESIPQRIVSLAKASLGKEESIHFLDI